MKLRESIDLRPVASGGEQGSNYLKSLEKAYLLVESST